MSSKDLKEKFCEPYKLNDDFDYYFGEGRNKVDDFINAGRVVEFRAFEAGYELAVSELNERLKEAEEVLEFYARSNNWEAKVVEDSADEYKTYATIDDRDTYAEFPTNAMGWTSIAGGKLAIEYFKKWNNS